MTGNLVVLGIFTHHAHTFFQKKTGIYKGFANTQFYVCGCSGDYKCKCTASSCDRGYYAGALTIQGNQVSLMVTPAVGEEEKA